MDSKLVYVGPDQELNSIVTSLRDLREEEQLALVVPAGARAFESRESLETVHRLATSFGQGLAVITSDARLQAWAGRIGLPVFSGLAAYDEGTPESPIPAGPQEPLPAEWLDPPPDSAESEGPTAELGSPLRLGLQAGWDGVRRNHRQLGVATLALTLVGGIGILVVPAATVTLTVIPNRVRSDVHLIGSTTSLGHGDHFPTQVIAVTESQTLTVTASGQRAVGYGSGTRIVRVVQQSDIDIARRTLEARLDVAAQQDLEKRARGLRLVPVGTPTYSQPNAGAVGAELSTFDLTETEAVEVVAFDDRVVSQMLREQARRALPPGSTLTGPAIQTWYEIQTANADGTVMLNGHVAAYARRDFSAATVRAAVKGVTPEQAQARLGTDPGVVRPTVVQGPWPMPWLPLLSSRIDVRIVESPRKTEPANLQVDLTRDGSPGLFGRLSEGGTDAPIPGARIEISYEHLDGGGDFAVYTLEGTVPATATQALGGLRVNAENGGPGPSDLSLYQMAYRQEGDEVNRVINADFGQGIAGWGSWGTSPGRLVRSDRGVGQMLQVTTAPAQSSLLNGTAFAVTAGKRFTFTVGARIAPASIESGYFTLIWLNGTEIHRERIAFQPPAQAHAFVATDDSGTFHYVLPASPAGRIRIQAGWAGDATRLPVLASITR